MFNRQCNQTLKAVGDIKSSLTCLNKWFCYFAQFKCIGDSSQFIFSESKIEIEESDMWEG